MADGVIGDAERSQRLRFLRIDDRTSGTITELRSQIEGSLPGLAKTFYSFLGEWPNLRTFLGDDANIARLQGAQIEHWLDLFKGEFDEGTFLRATAIGRAHERIGLEPSWYLGGYCFILERLIAQLHQSSDKQRFPELVNALLRTVFLDMDLAISTYIELGQAGKLKREMLSLSEVIEREVGLSVADIGQQVDKLGLGAKELTEVARSLTEAAQAVAVAVNTTSDDVQTVADAAEQLETSSRGITSQVNGASALTDAARTKAEEAADTVASLREATGRIQDVVRLIRSIAGQTRLLALNATIEAARAGDAGKGFVVVAEEVKRLARQTDEGIGGVNRQAQEIGRATDSTVDAVETIAESIRDIDAIAQQVATASEEQRAATSEIMGGAHRAAEQTRAVADHARSVLDVASKTGQTAEWVNSLSLVLRREVGDLQRRLSIILRSSFAGDRRSAERVALALGFTTQGFSGQTGDISTSGVLLAVPSDKARIGAELELDIQEVGVARAEVVAASALGLHMRFLAASPEIRKRIMEVQHQAKEHDGAFTAIVADVAQTVSAGFERALRDGRISIDDLFDTRYQPIEGTEPQQFLAPHAKLTDQVVAPVIEPPLDHDPRIVFCCVCDRNGYIATHNRKYSEPQKPGDKAWNTAHSRNRRIFDDRAGLVAARNTIPGFVQTYPRDMGGGNMVVLKEFDAPIAVGGKHWGTVRLAVKP